MKFTTTFLLVVGIISSAVNANIALTSPYTSITWQANKKYVVTWEDNGQEPLLKKLGTVNVDLVTGSDGNYILVKNIANVKATQKKTPSWEVPKELGPPGAYYFIRTTSGDNLSFSGKFDIQGITGTIPGFTPTDTTNSFVSIALQYL
ncbi:6075_t:CDS:2 [Ambispora gerdemannii]|uniref:6075_t:CDS:1 n=1 Tax=Ambispora gerdemannii TaxID=144530 RepID=A0A9N8WD31_9GLOM|nr:6075_t:CDS:2 [Ambispora gerdemannii]